jgi:hypothetical protein
VASPLLYITWDLLAYPLNKLSFAGEEDEKVKKITLISFY